MRKKIITAVGVVVLVALMVSGWCYALAESRSNARDLELLQLNTSFVQQYGTDGITVQQLTQPEKFYMAVWTAKDGSTNTSWSIGGIWVTVYTSNMMATT